MEADNTRGQTILSGSETSEQKQLSPKLYAQLVHGLSKRTSHFSYSRKHYAALARFLMSPYQRYQLDESSTPSDTSTSSICVLDPEQSGENRVHIIGSLEDLNRYDEKARRKQTGGRLLFLQGFVSPMWLNCLGSKFEVDPEFYFRHLDFTSLFPSPDHFNMMSLPSMADIVRIHMVFILSWNGVHPSGDSTAELRSSCKAQMSKYLHNLVNEQEIIPDDSIVRRFSVHDKHHFSIEQLVTVQVNHDHPGWLAFIWLDQGKDLRFSNCGPWTALEQERLGKLVLQPIGQYRRRIGLRGAYRDQEEGQPSSQSLVSTYGSSLQPKLMASDAFYALEDLFRISIASESQFLTLISHKIKVAIADRQIEDLSNSRNIIEDHIEAIRENIESVRVGGHLSWPKASEQAQYATALESRNELQKDLEHLLIYSQRLSEMCSEGITTMMNDVMYRQSQLALQETKAMLKLSVLVFFFAPISVTTSLFSMEVTEISRGNLSIWAWVFTTFVAVVISFVFWKWNPLERIGQDWAWLVSKSANWKPW